MTRETTASKGARYLAEGRLIVTAVDGDHVAATCRGDGEIYELGHTPGWGGTAAARSGGTAAHT
jgi:hypothetical protein